MTSESTRFLGQPNETKPTVGAVGWEDLLTLLLYPEAISAPALTEQPVNRLSGSACSQNAYVFFILT